MKRLFAALVYFDVVFDQIIKEGHPSSKDFKKCVYKFTKWPDETDKNVIENSFEIE